MRRSKTLDLSMLSDKDVRNVELAVSQWVNSGRPGVFGFITDKDLLRFEKAVIRNYKRGRCKGFIKGAAGMGIAICLISAIANRIEETNEERTKQNSED